MMLSKGQVVCRPKRNYIKFSRAIPRGRGEICLDILLMHFL